MKTILKFHKSLLSILLLAIMTSCKQPHSTSDNQQINLVDTVAQGPTEAEKQEIARQKNAASIETVLQEDSTVAIAAENRGNNTAISKAMRQIDITSCPTDFQAAYVDHIHAWEDSGKIQTAWNKLESDDNINDVLLRSILEDVVGSDATPIKDAVDAEKFLKEAKIEASAKISETFKQVEHIAATYGAKLPQKF